MTATITEPDATATQDPDELDHIVCCCNDVIALCGYDASQDAWAPEDAYECDDDVCPRCAEISDMDVPCILCGYSSKDIPKCACGKCWIWSLEPWQQDIMRKLQPNLFI